MPRAFVSLLIVLACLCACSQKEAAKLKASSNNEAAQFVAGGSTYTDIRSIDFRNFDYPKIPGWTRKEIHLREGIQRNLFKEPEDVEADSPWYGQASLGQVIYSYDEQGQSIAFVIVAVESGGTAAWDEILLYGLVNHEPKLLWSFETGDRADGGLRTLYFESGSGNFVLELYEEGAGDGLCCASHFSRHFYNWRDGKLVELGSQDWIPLPKQPNRPVARVHR